MNKTQLIKKTEKFVRQALANQDPGHDFEHITRVLNNAKRIAKKEGGNLFIIKLGALLHDIADWKFNNGNAAKGPKLAAAWLKKNKVDPKIISQVKDVVDKVTFKGAGNIRKPKTLEGKIVQDADRLDALGAVGIARAFVYGGRVGRKMYDPKAKPIFHKDFKSYKKNDSATLNHFYEKLLLLKGLMNTKTAKKIATDRHKYMFGFVRRFKQEWHEK